MNTAYNEDYYERGIELNISGYSNYRWIPELTIPLAFRIIEALKIKSNETVLDYGCAKGFLVKALRHLYRYGYGYDISEYATENAPQDVKKYILPNLDHRHFNCLVCKDVLEHVPYKELDNVLRNIYDCADRFFFIVPLGQDGKYIIPSYDLDVTHIIKEPIEWWREKFKSRGFVIINESYKIKNIKENYAHYDTGNGFFILEK